MSRRVGGSHGLLSTLRRLVSALRAGHQRWAGRRSDHALADIGVCRANLHAAMSGVIPIEHIARADGDRRWTAPIQQLRHRPAEALAANDLSIAA
jgi:uncharacterized protein YjiS (DUF1127 family)